VTDHPADDVGRLVRRAADWASSCLADPWLAPADGLARLLPIVLATAGADAGAVLLLDPDGQRLVLAAASGRASGPPHAPTVWPCAGGAARALRTAGAQLLVNGPAVLLPLVSDGQLVGAFVLSHACPLEDRLCLLELLATQSAALVLATRLRQRQHAEQPERALAPDLRLPRRQQQVLDLIVGGRSGPEIAATLGLSRETVKDHTARLCARFGARGRAHLVALVSAPTVEVGDAHHATMGAPALRVAGTQQRTHPGRL
jgi:DNA-binding CsgD family transcriptional regulator